MTRARFAPKASMEIIQAVWSVRLAVMVSFVWKVQESYYCFKTAAFCQF